MSSDSLQKQSRSGLFGLFGKGRRQGDAQNGETDIPTWSMGVLNDRTTVEVPGSVLLLASDRNEPLGLRNVHARTSHSSIPAGFAVEQPPTPGGSRPPAPVPDPNPQRPSGEPAGQEDEEDNTKKTDDGNIILIPQPEESANDPLNWPSWRRDLALLCLGFYCMVGGGMTPILAAGFQNVSETFDVPIDRVSLTTGLYMMGLGVGSVIFSPTAILWGKRPVYLFGSIMFIATSLWAGFSPSFPSLIAARVFQGIAVSPVECLPSATIAEIFFLHERAFRIGMYTLLLLSGKNLVPLVSAAIISSFGWRWVFWIVAIIVALGGVLLFFFVPETFWDRTPSRKHQHSRPSFLRRLSSRHLEQTQKAHETAATLNEGNADEEPLSPGAIERRRDVHVGFALDGRADVDSKGEGKEARIDIPRPTHQPRQFSTEAHGALAGPSDPTRVTASGRSAAEFATTEMDAASQRPRKLPLQASESHPVVSAGNANNLPLSTQERNDDPEKCASFSSTVPPSGKAYTHNLRHQPPRSFAQQLRPFNGRLNQDKWVKVMMRPFILYTYPAVLWSSAVYACSIGWLIVISEAVSLIYREKPYGFTALGAGLVYISPFIGGILGTGVAGKISDIIVRFMARRNGGLYEPEFRLVMAIPIVITTCIGLMGFGWSAQSGDQWIVPTVFFGIVSFGCSLGSTTAITFCVDSYRQYAGEALVTLNFSKNIFHGLVFSLFITNWITDDGTKWVFIWLGIIQLIVLLTTIPLFIYGKRLRMWTYRKNLVEIF